MLKLAYSQFGNPAAVVHPAEAGVPEPGAGEVRLRMVRSPIHNHDLATIRGIYGVRPQLPATGGSELLGVVDAVGPNVSGIAQGARVACTTRGAWAQYVLAPASSLVPVPEAVPDNEAAQLISMPLSAMVLLDDLRVRAGDWIVQNAANGAVARIVDAEARSRGINVIGLVRSEETAQQLREFGAQHVVVTQGDWPKRVREVTGGAPVVRAIDSVAGSGTLELQRLLGEGGELIVFGALSGEAMRLDPGLMIERQLIVRGFWMTALGKHPDGGARLAKAMQRVVELAARRELPLAVAGEYALTDVRDALIAAESPGRNGKVLLTP